MSIFDDGLGLTDEEEEEEEEEDTGVGTSLRHSMSLRRVWAILVSFGVE